jgi:hypothetical protein
MMGPPVSGVFISLLVGWTELLESNVLYKVNSDWRVVRLLGNLVGMRYHSFTEHARV